MDRIGMEVPGMLKSMGERDAARRTFPMTNDENPGQAKECANENASGRTLFGVSNVILMHIIPNTGSQLSKCDQLCVGEELPACVKLEITSGEFCQETPVGNKGDLKRRISLRIVIGPTFAQSRSEAAVSDWTKLLDDSTLLVDTLSRMDKGRSSLTKPMTNMPLPT
jgi:hypothetical protein